MICIQCVTFSGEPVWTGFVPALPPPGMTLAVNYPPEADRGNEPRVRSFQVQGAAMALNSESAYAPAAIQVLVRDLSTPNIITAGTIQ